MTPHLAALTYRARLACAASYAHFITETDPDTLTRWAGDYKTGDIQLWARERIANILSECARLQLLFANDEKLVSAVQSAAQNSLEVLARIGCPSGSVLDAGIMRIEK